MKCGTIGIDNELEEFGTFSLDIFLKKMQFIPSSVDTERIQ
jgi:hypothetical protein